ncbi:protein asteroid homolog 1-like [Argiope bruennichi]|uniref:protein asteroid homolog 1-like n=1 Tax=Argiope bruennichi TaxID=94029 RepID=UPI0024944342|nr:protein asteroid homolog 1-like [Argiope bruennichi]
MGIRGLSTFFNNNPDLTKSHKLYNTPVIIDGNNLIHLLYFSNKIDCMYGGDYYKYAKAIRKYFSAFHECNIKPIVIFDGGYDKSDRKFQTSILRSKTRLSLTQHIAKYGDCAGNILPICAKEVFRDILCEMGISFALCDFEADEQITALANHYKCPVLSDDSDFFIFDVHNGFIRLSSVEMIVQEDDVEGITRKYLECEIYHIDKFLSYFPGLDRNVLPLFGTLVGNDYANSKEFETFFASINISKRNCRGLRVNPRQRKIVRLLTWLEHCNLNEAIKQVLDHLKKKKRERIEDVINMSIDGYKAQNSYLMHVVEGSLDELSRLLNLNPKLKTPCCQTLPTPFVIAFHLGKLPSFFLNIINLHRTFLQAQVENTSVESSYVCSRYIRQVIYGILLKHVAADEKTHEEDCLRHIDEYDHRTGLLSREPISASFNLTNGDSVPSIEDAFLMEKKHSRQFLLDVLGADLDVIKSLPDKLQLFFSCIIYWLKNCSPQPSEDFLHALILNIIYFQVVLKKSSAQEVENNLIANISSDDIELAAQNMKKYLQKPTFNKGNPLFLDIVHSFSQLQTCILYTMYLNSLLCFPYKNPKLHETVAGTLLYNLTKDLLHRPFPDLFISELLGRKSKLRSLFDSLKEKLFSSVPEDCIKQTDRSHLQKVKKDVKKSGNRKKCLSNADEKDIDALCAELDNMTTHSKTMTIERLGEIFI